MNPRRDSLGGLIENNQINTIQLPRTSDQNTKFNSKMQRMSGTEKMSVPLGVLYLNYCKRQAGQSSQVSTTRQFILQHNTFIAVGRPISNTGQLGVDVNTNLLRALKTNNFWSDLITATSGSSVARPGTPRSVQATMLLRISRSLTCFRTWSSGGSASPQRGRFRLLPTCPQTRCSTRRTR